MSSLTLVLLLGTGAMFLCMWYGGKIYAIPVWKIAISAFLLTAVGLLGAHLMSLLESGKWNGRSFFGAVFLAPILMWPVAKVLKIPYGNLMDLCAPAECVMLALLKVKCRIDHCCIGRFINLGDYEIRFPSQITECVTAILLMFVLLVIIKKQKWSGMVFPWYLLLYGVLRSILNLLRETTPWIGPLSAGNFWALISIILGGGILLLRNRIGKSS